LFSGMQFAFLFKENPLLKTIQIGRQILN
jgi:hypothetical protein